MVLRALFRRVPISAYLSGFVIAALVPALVLAYVYMEKGAAIRASAMEQMRGLAQTEIENAVLHEAAEITGLARSLSEWDETLAQFDDSTYYQYWKQTRVRGAGWFSNLVDAVELYDAKGRALAPDSTLDSTIIPRAVGEPALVRRGGQVLLVYFHPVAARLPGSRVRVIGYAGVRADVADLLAHRGAFLYSDAASVEWELAEGVPVSLHAGVAAARPKLYRSKPIDAFAELVRSSFRQYLLYMVSVLLAITGLLLLTVARPLQRLARHIHEMKEGRLERLPGNIRNGLRIAELESVREAVNDYRDMARAANERLLEKNQELQLLTYRDTLTGVYNRRAFESHLQQALHAARTRDREHALCYLDLDQFKVVNDTCGHMAGDELLKQVASRLQAEIREGDMLARLGGDEFGILLENCRVEKAAEVADKLRQSLKKFRFAWEDKLFDVGGSMGLVPIDAQSGGLTDVLKAADSACYVAKDLGRNRVHVYQADDKDLTQRFGEMQWIGRINKALEENRFELYCQKIVPLSEDAPAPHFEILIRMRDEHGELVPPMAFLPAAERYNLMPAIDRWVVGTALEAMHSGALTVDGQEPVIAINLSGQSLGDDDFLAFVAAALDEPQARPDRICFEITETAAITNLMVASRFIATLHERGCKFSLDDFGSGLSSFGYLKNLNVDYLKIDGHFVRQVAEDPISYSMVEAINHIGHVMGLQTIAEFVENRDILAKLRKIGVDFVQGYGMERPKPMATLASPGKEARKAPAPLPLVR